MTNKLVASVILPAMLGVLTSNVFADRAMRVQDAIWANDTVYDTILTDTNFKSPPEGSTDALYNFGMSGLMGQRAVAESAPGDRDYNGGRWDVKLVMFTTQGLAAHDPDGDGTANFELTNAADVLHHEMLGHIEIMDANHYFECPLLR
ncbi:MAG: hypothetical protein OEU44_04060 [Gammaproteobacteria bacterium]|nr:hypothetical protein [Gammaproteobacteria bacterium]